MIDAEGERPITDSDHDSRESAAERVAFLNGGGKSADGEFLAQAKGQIGDTAQNISSLTYAMIAQAEAMERIAVAMERQAAALEKLASVVATDVGGSYICQSSIDM